MKARTFRGKPQSQGLHPLNQRKKKEKRGRGGGMPTQRPRKNIIKEEKLCSCWMKQIQIDDKQMNKHKNISVLS